MPRRSAAKTPAAAPRAPTGPFIVRNPRGIPKGRVILRFHACLVDREDPDDHSECIDLRWYEGDTCEPPPAGFDTARFLEHQPMPGRSCDDGTHTDCAGPYLEKASKGEEVSSDG